MIFHSHASKTHFHTKGCALGLILKVRVFGTRKCPIWRSLDPVSPILYNSCFWSDCPSSLIIMSSVIICGSPPHKGRKLKWGSVVDPGEGPLHPPPPSPALFLDQTEARRVEKILGRDYTAASRLSRVGWFSRALAFRSIYYPCGKMGTTRSLTK